MIIQNHDEFSAARPSSTAPQSQLIDWFAEGQGVAVEFAGTVVTIRYVSRKGRRARIAITGAEGAVFRTLDSSEVAWSLDCSS